MVKSLGIFLGWVLLCCTAAPAASLADWQELEPGLAVGHFDSRAAKHASKGDLTVLRIEPHLFELRVLRAERGAENAGRNIDQWCAEFELVAAINLGMFQADRHTHVGYCQVGGQVVNGFANDYLSAAAFGPRESSDPPFQIFDLDQTPLSEVAQRYRNVVQNLRLIKHERENRWQPAADQWREAALAEDAQGRILLVFCRTPWSMSEFNRILLELPLNVVAAQHLEGRSQARLRVNHPQYEGGPESGASGPVLPNILGVKRRVPAPD